MIESEICLNNAMGICKYVMTQTWCSPQCANTPHWQREYCLLTGEALHRIELTDGTLGGRLSCSHYDPKE